MTATFFPYPGGKGKLRAPIVQAISKHKFSEYREPFFGGGAIGLHVATESHADCWFNDLDIGIYSLWKAVSNHHHDLIKRVREFEPSVERFHYLKEFFRNPIETDDPVEIGFNKLAVHKLSFSGLGERGCVKGGQGQSRFHVERYWSPNYIVNKIEYIHDCFRWGPPVITYSDYSKVIEQRPNDGGSQVMLYVDPPYYDQGPAVYRHSFLDQDHVRLANLLRETDHHWVLSYDDHWRIRDLYEWTQLETLSVTYSIARSGTRRNELLITPRRPTVH
jgi:DNA adenine methylase